MAIADRLPQGEGDTGTRSQDRILRHSQSLGDFVGGAKPDAPDVTRQTVGILLDQWHGVGTVRFVDANGSVTSRRHVIAGRR